MLKIFTVSFFGHRVVDDFGFAEFAVRSMVETLMKKNNYTEFLVGRNGEFDQIVSSVILRAKRKFETGDNRHICVLPYLTAEYQQNRRAFENYYDEVIAPVNVLPKGAIQERNRWMVDNSNLCIFCVDRKSGGAWQTLQYALQQQKNMVNYGKIGYDFD